MKFTLRSSLSLLAMSWLATSTFLACSEENNDTKPRDNGEETNDADGGDAGSDDERPTNSAIAVVGQAYTPEDYFTYVGVFPEVPEGDVSFKNFREFGNANVYVFDGRLFVQEGSNVQRFDVNEDLELEDGPKFSWVDFGVPSGNAVSTVFISKTRAYSLAPELGVIIIWDPSTMERTGAIELEFPERSESMETWASDGYVIGDRVVWNVFSGDFNDVKPYPAVTLVIADSKKETAPTFVEDSRCLPGGPSFVDDNGDYYVHGGGFFGYFWAYGEIEDARTCVLRMNAGEYEFDEDYLLDYEEITGSYINNMWIRVNADQYVTRAWDPEVPVPEVADDFWLGEGLRSLIIDVKEGTAIPYPDLEATLDIDGTTRIVDGVSYFQVSETGYVEGGDTEVVELHPDGIVPKFHLTAGFLLNLERVR